VKLFVKTEDVAYLERGIAAYEAALKIDPSYESAKQGLEEAKARRAKIQ